METRAFESADHAAGSAAAMLADGERLSRLWRYVFVQLGLRLGDLLTDAGLTVERCACRAPVIRVPPGMRPPSWAARDDMVAEGLSSNLPVVGPQKGLAAAAV